MQNFVILMGRKILNLHSPINHQIFEKKKKELSALSRENFGDALEIVFLGDSLVEWLLSTHSMNLATYNLNLIIFFLCIYVDFWW